MKKPKAQKPALIEDTAAKQAAEEAARLEAERKGRVEKAMQGLRGRRSLITGGFAGFRPSLG